MFLPSYDPKLQNKGGPINVCLHTNKSILTAMSLLTQWPISQVQCYAPLLGIDAGQGLSQDLETGCPKFMKLALVMVKLLGIHFL